MDNKQLLSTSQVLSLQNKVKQAERHNLQDFTIFDNQDTIKAECRMRGYANDDLAWLSSNDQRLMHQALSKSEEIYIQARTNINKFLQGADGINKLQSSRPYHQVSMHDPKDGKQISLVGTLQTQ